MAKTKAPAQQALSLQRRPVQGTRPVRRIRRQGIVPGVVYGRGMEPVAVAVNSRELVKLLRSKSGERALMTLRMDDGKPWEKPALVKAIQHDPVDGRILHVDFHAIVLTERLRVKDPVILKGEPVGVKQDGGILEHFLREVEVECLPTQMPERVESDVSALKIGETIHVRDLIPPPDSTITSDPQGVIASVQAPREEKPEEEAAPTEPEVIREKKAEGEEAPGEGTKASEPAESKKEAKAEPKKDTKA